MKVIKFGPRSSHMEMRIEFPGGSVAVTRRSDGEGYWAHVTRDRAPYENAPYGYGTVTDSRIDREGVGVNETNRGDLVAADVYHVALCIKEVQS